MSLMLSTEYVADVLQKKKLSTIRYGRRQIPLGSSVFVTSKGDIPIHISQVRYCEFSKLTIDDAKKDGFHSLDDLITAMRRFYPKISNSDLVTIINFHLEEI